MARILIVEDDHAVVHMLELTFATEGFETETVLDGQAALDRIAEGDPVDVVILDIMMPEVDGYTVLEELRADDVWTGTKVVITSALKTDEDVWKGWAAGTDYYLAKPFDLDHLRDVVNRLIAGAPVV
ncbi:MAG: response regulator transcription factor [Nitriliruptorales bacterium]|nr:response regulator transcription factor [Nitriliruptorales bacterium]